MSSTDMILSMDSPHILVVTIIGYIYGGSTRDQYGNSMSFKLPDRVTVQTNSDPKFWGDLSSYHPLEARVHRLPVDIQLTTTR
jgi:hypothetical protein